MPKANCQKIKLLKLKEILSQETDENHPLRTSELCAKLNALNISSECRTLGQDIKLLNIPKLLPEKSTEPPVFASQDGCSTHEICCQ